MGHRKKERKKERGGLTYTDPVWRGAGLDERPRAQSHHPGRVGAWVGAGGCGGVAVGICGSGRGRRRSKEMVEEVVVVGGWRSRRGAG